jgi:hypothetical protein
VSLREIDDTTPLRDLVVIRLGNDDTPLGYKLLDQFS